VLLRITCKHLQEYKTGGHNLDLISNLASKYIGGRVSIDVANGSKTALTDVIRSPSEPLGSNTVQLYESLGSRYTWAGSEAGFSSQCGDRG
jgi:hypothetical protein